MNKTKKIKQALGNYTSHDVEDEVIIANLKKALTQNPDGLADYVEGIVMWQKVEFAFTIKEFCELIGVKTE